MIKQAAHNQSWESEREREKNWEGRKISNQIVIFIFISLDSLRSSSLSPCSAPRISSTGGKYERCQMLLQTHLLDLSFSSLFSFVILRRSEIICGSCSRTRCNGGNWSNKDRLSGAWSVGTWKANSRVYETCELFSNLLLQKLLLA